jgi:hypothetical protein
MHVCASRFCWKIIVLASVGGRAAIEDGWFSIVPCLHGLIASTAHASVEINQQRAARNPEPRVNRAKQTPATTSTCGSRHLWLPDTHWLATLHDLARV